MSRFADIFKILVLITKYFYYYLTLYRKVNKKNYSSNELQLFLTPFLTLAFSFVTISHLIYSFPAWALLPVLC